MTLAQKQPDYDVIAVGAGFAGLGLIHYMREAGLSVRVFDKATDIGGTWTWNRYPGAASDSECYYYCLSFSKELLQEWLQGKCKHAAQFAFIRCKGKHATDARSHKAGLWQDCLSDANDFPRGVFTEPDAKQAGFSGAL